MILTNTIILIKIILVLLGVAYFTIIKRKVMVAVQRAHGPDVVCFLGLLQPLADGLKLIVKGVLITTKTEQIGFLLAPIIILTLSLLNWSIIPFGFFEHNFVPSLTNLEGNEYFHKILVGAVMANIKYGLLFLLVISSFNVYGIIIAGWSSISKDALFGILRLLISRISLVPLGSQFLFLRSRITQKVTRNTVCCLPLFVVVDPITAGTVVASTGITVAALNIVLPIGFALMSLYFFKGWCTNIGTNLSEPIVHTTAVVWKQIPISIPNPVIVPSPGRLDVMSTISNYDQVSVLKSNSDFRQLYMQQLDLPGNPIGQALNTLKNYKMIRPPAVLPPELSQLHYYNEALKLGLQEMPQIRFEFLLKNLKLDFSWWAHANWEHGMPFLSPVFNTESQYVIAGFSTLVLWALRAEIKTLFENTLVAYARMTCGESLTALLEDCINALHTQWYTTYTHDHNPCRNLRDTISSILGMESSIEKIEAFINRIWDGPLDAVAFAWCERLSTYLCVERTAVNIELFVEANYWLFFSIAEKSFKEAIENIGLTAEETYEVSGEGLFNEFLNLMFHFS